MPSLLTPKHWGTAICPRDKTNDGAGVDPKKCERRGARGAVRGGDRCVGGNHSRLPWDTEARRQRFCLAPFSAGAAGQATPKPTPGASGMISMRPPTWPAPGLTAWGGQALSRALFSPRILAPGG